MASGTGKGELKLHSRVMARLKEGPPTRDKVIGSTGNDWLAERITKLVGTMWCAYAFAFIALISLPDAVSGGRPTLIAWIAQTFIQLVLLSIIMVGQNIAAKASDARAVATYDDADAILHHVLAIQALIESRLPEKNQQGGSMT